MKQIQALFFDIDGTLLEFGKNRIQDSVVESIQAAQKKGYKIALASSRPLTIINDVENIWDIHWDGIVAGSGTLIYDENKTIYKDHSLSKETLKQIFQLAKDNNIAVYTCGKESFFTNWNSLTQWLQKTYHVTSNIVHPYQNESVQLITLLSSDYNALLNTFKDVSGIRLVKGGPHNADIFPAQINKCTGIHELMKKWNLAKQNYMCFGDTCGDHDMILDAHIGIAMKNGMEETKQIADYVCQSIPEGLIHFHIL